MESKLFEFCVTNNIDYVEIVDKSQVPPIYRLLFDNKMFEPNKMSKETYFYLGLYYELQQDYSNMKKYYSLGCDNKCYHSFYRLGMFYENLGNEYNMVECYKGAIALGDKRSVVALEKYFQSKNKMVQYYEIIQEYCNIDLLIDLASEWLKKNNYNMMIKYYNYAISKGSTRAMIKIAHFYRTCYEITNYKNNDKDIAQDIEMYIKMNNGDDEKEHVDYAEKYYKMAIDNNNDDAIIELFDYYRNTNRQSDMENVVKMAISKNKLEIIVNFIKLFRETNNIKNLDECFELFIKNKRYNEILDTANYYKEKKDLAHMIKYYELASQNNCDEAHINLGKYYEDMCDYINAIKYYQKAIIVKNTDAMLLLGHLYEKNLENTKFDEQNKYEKMIQYFLMSAEGFNVQGMKKMAFYCKKQKDYDQMLKWYKQIYSRNQDDLEIQINLGEYYRESKCFISMKIIMLNVLEKDPTNVSILVDLAVYYKHSHYYGEMEKYLLKAIEKGSTIAMVLYGNYLKTQQNYNKMSLYYDMALDKKCPFAMLAYAYYYYEQKDHDKIIKYAAMSYANNLYDAVFILIDYFDELKDYEKVKYYALLAINKKHNIGRATIKLGDVYKNEKDYENMKKCYLMEMKDKYYETIAMLRMGDFYLQENNDYENAVKYYNAALLNGSKYAALKLADYFKLNNDYENFRYYCFKAMTKIEETFSNIHPPIDPLDTISIKKKQNMEHNLKNDNDNDDKNSEINDSIHKVKNQCYNLMKNVFETKNIDDLYEKYIIDKLYYTKRLTYFEPTLFKTNSKTCFDEENLDDPIYSNKGFYDKITGLPINNFVFKNINDDETYPRKREFREYDNCNSQYEAQLKLAHFYVEIGDITRASIFYLTAFYMIEKLGQKINPDETIIRKYLEILENYNNFAFNLGSTCEKMKLTMGIILFYEKACEFGCSQAMINLGNFYKMIKNFSNMIKCYLMAVEKDVPEAMFNLGQYYEEKHDFVNMIKYYELAVNKKNEVAMINLGNYYKNIGDIVNMDKYYIMAYKQCNVDISLTFGFDYLNKKNSQFIKQLLLEDEFNTKNLNIYFKKNFNIVQAIKLWKYFDNENARKFNKILCDHYFLLESPLHV